MLAKLFKGILTLYRWIRSFCFNLLFISLLLIVLAALFSSTQLDIPDGAALVISPVGTLVEELSSVDTIGDLIGGGGTPDEVLLQDLPNINQANL